MIIHEQYNMGHICTQQQCDNGLGDKVALHWLNADNRPERYTFAQLNNISNQFANILSQLGAKEGNVLATLMPKTPEHFAAFLGALKCRLVCAPLFSNSGDEAICERLNDSASWGLITKKSLLKKVLRIRERVPTLKVILVMDSDEDLCSSVLSVKKRMETGGTEFHTPVTHANTPSVLHYTSGSTGKPKGVLHVHGGIRTQHESIKNILQLTPNDIYWCTADHGWVTGTTYGITAPWSAGITQLHYGGMYNARKWLEILAREKVSVWYTAPTALRMLMREAPYNLNEYDLSALKYIFSVGEPLNPEVIKWSRRFLHKEVYDTWFQTETGSIMVANRPGLRVKPGSMGIPAPGIHAEVHNPQDREGTENHAGILALKADWSSMFTAYLNQEQAYKSKFQNGYYLSGDEVRCDQDGYYWFVGRSDDVINTGGHLVSPFEIESALLELDEVAESAAVGVTDDILFEKIVVFITLNDDFTPDKDTEIKIRLHISKRVSTVATPQQVIFTAALPKNSSGKIMRRVLRAQLSGVPEPDTSTLEKN